MDHVLYIIWVILFNYCEANWVNLVYEMCHVNKAALPCQIRPKAKRDAKRRHRKPPDALVWLNGTLMSHEGQFTVSLYAPPAQPTSRFWPVLLPLPLTSRFWPVLLPLLPINPTLLVYDDVCDKCCPLGSHYSQNKSLFFHSKCFVSILGWQGLHFLCHFFFFILKNCFHSF